MAELLSEIGSDKPRSRDLIGAGLTSATNALGGFFAGRIDGYASDKWPKHPAYPVVAVMLVSVGLRYYFSAAGKWPAFAREVAAGMAGWVGDDLWYAIRDFFGFGVKPWTGGQTYKLADKVTYQGKTWQANKDVPAVPLAEPGKDARWTLAQGYKIEAYREAAQAILADDDLWKNVADLQAEEVAPAIEQMTNTQLEPEDHRRLVEKMRTSLSRAVQAAA